MRKWCRRGLLVLLCAAVIAGAVVAFPVIRRKIEDRGAVWLQENAGWTQVGELQGGAQEVTVRFDSTEGPIQLEIRAEHLVGGEWTQGEAFSLHLAEEKLCSLPEAQQHRFMARPVREPDDDRTYINGDVWIVITPAQ